MSPEEQKQLVALFVTLVLYVSLLFFNFTFSFMLGEFKSFKLEQELQASEISLVYDSAEKVEIHRDVLWQKSSNFINSVNSIFQ